MALNMNVLTNYKYTADKVKARRHSSTSGEGGDEHITYSDDKT